MRGLGWLLLLLLLAAGAAALAPWLREDPGYVLLMLRGVAVETSLVFLLLTGAMSALLLWLAWRLVWLPWQGWLRLRRGRARRRLGEGLLAMGQGRLLRAERLLSSVAGGPEQRLPALLEAARASLAQGSRVRAEEYLRAAERLPAGPLAVALFRAERALAAGDAEAALRWLETCQESSSRVPRLGWLRLQALRALGRYGEALAELPALRRSGLIDASAVERIEHELEIELLEHAPDAATLAAAWRHAPRKLRQQAEVLAAYARRANALGLADQAVEALETALAQHWDERLMALYAALPATDAGPRLRRCEAWLGEHSQSPALLLALGRLCAEEQLWGKAEDYLRASLAHQPSAEAWQGLARVREAQGDCASAIVALHNALAIVGQRPVDTLPLLRRSASVEAALVERRDALGLPRLVSSSG